MRHPAAANPDPSVRGTVGAVVAMAAVVMTVMFPTAMAAAAVSVVAVTAVGRMVDVKRPSTAMIPGVDDGSQVSSGTECNTVCD